METHYLAGVKVNNISKQEFLDEIDRLVREDTKSYVVTPYSEFIVTAQKDKEFLNVINSAAISTIDGFGIILGIKYNSLKGKILPMLRCLLAALFTPSFFKDTVKAKLSGSEFIYDVAELASQRKYKLFLLGGFDFGSGNTGELTRDKLKELYPDIEIVGTYSGSAKVEEEEEIIKRTNASGAQLLFIAYGPVSQEKWIYRNKDRLNANVSFCLGGTFDYVSGVKQKVSKDLGNRGFEGILRPFVSEKTPALMFKRLKRAWIGIVKFIFVLIKNKK